LEEAIAKQEKIKVKANAKVKALTEQIAQARSSMGSHEQGLEQGTKPFGAAEVSDGTRKMLHSRLDVIIRRFAKRTEELNTLCASNDVIKGDIDGLRTDAVYFQRNLKRLNAKLVDVKSAHAVVDLKIEGWYKERDNAQLSMMELEKERESGMKQFKGGWAEIQKKLGETDANVTDIVIKRENDMKEKKKKDRSKKKKLMRQDTQKFQRNIIGHTDLARLKQCQESEKTILSMTTAGSMKELLREVLDLEDHVSCSLGGGGGGGWGAGEGR
jgi:hypothetical protein